MKGISIRKACEDDAEKICSLRKSSVDEASLNLQGILSEIENSSNVSGLYVTEDEENNIIGSCFFYFSFHRNGFTCMHVDFSKDNDESINIEIMNKFISLCFYELNYNKVNVWTLPCEAENINVCESVGFKLEVISKEKIFSNGNYSDVYQFGLTKKDYIDKKIYNEELPANYKDSTDYDFMLDAKVSFDKNLLKGSKIDLVEIKQEYIEKMAEDAASSDEQSFVSLGAAVPMNYNSLSRYSNNFNDYYFLNSDFLFGIAKKNGDVIGTVSIDTIDQKNRNAMIGISIYDKDERGKGFGSEAINLLTDFIFLELNMHRVYFGCFSFNKNAGKLYEHLGFKKEGCNRDFLYRNGKYYDEIQFAILKKDWLMQRGYLEQ